ncbi:PAS domain-containing protein, partial [Poseidonibacter sp.]|uniref:PAS domain-containing protein n=1 Tax=Poseidonibacter sp. TaxID=2321188 RepID=UPI003C73A29A
SDDVQSIKFWQEHIHKDDYKKTIFNLKKHLARKTNLYEDEYRFRCKDGSYKWIKVRGKAFFENNKAYRITGFHTDINDVKLLQQDNNKKEQMLYQQSKLASMGEMISNIAHQWRQPLSLISTISSSLIVQIQLGIFEEKDGKRDLEKVLKSVEYLSTIIEKFRNFFNPNNEREIFSIDNIVRENLEIFETSYKSYNIEFILDLDKSEIIGYKFELIQVIINILNNAKDALLEKVKSENRRLIFLKCYKTDNNAVIKIYDNAGGINRNLKEKIYEPYFTTKHQSQGTGLGLYMSNEIIKNHFKGSLLNETISYKYENKSYKGEEFTIKIPLSI